MGPGLEIECELDGLLPLCTYSVRLAPNPQSPRHTPAPALNLPLHHAHSFLAVSAAQTIHRISEIGRATPRGLGTGHPSVGAVLVRERQRMGPLVSAVRRACTVDGAESTTVRSLAGERKPDSRHIPVQLVSRIPLLHGHAH